MGYVGLRKASLPREHRRMGHSDFPDGCWLFVCYPPVGLFSVPRIAAAALVFNGIGCGSISTNIVAEILPFAWAFHRRRIMKLLDKTDPRSFSPTSESSGHSSDKQGIQRF